MKIEVQIGCEFGYSDIARSVLENMDASTQLVVPMSSAVTMHDAKSFSHQIEEFIKIESCHGAAISNASDYPSFHLFNVCYKDRKSVVTVADIVCSQGKDKGFDIVHLYGCELFFDGLDGFSSDEFMMFCSGAKKVIAYFSEPYVATLPCVEMLQGVMNRCDVSFVYRPRTGVVADGETDGDFGLCGECSHRVFVGRPVELCSEVHLKMAGGDEVSRKGIGEDVRCTTCARRYRAGNGWRLAVNKRCPHYAEHFVSKANSVE
jgi:hypothetical protein